MELQSCPHRQPFVFRRKRKSHIQFAICETSARQPSRQRAKNQRYFGRLLQRLLPAAFNEMELTNGLMLGGGIEYHIRKGNGNTTAVKTSNAENNGVDEMFGKQYDFRLLYGFHGHRNNIIVSMDRKRSPFAPTTPPLNRVCPKHKNILGSSSEDNRLEIDISQIYRWGS